MKINNNRNPLPINPTIIKTTMMTICKTLKLIHFLMAMYFGFKLISMDNFIHLHLIRICNCQYYVEFMMFHLIGVLIVIALGLEVLRLKIKTVINLVGVKNSLFQINNNLHFKSSISSSSKKTSNNLIFKAPFLQSRRQVVFQVTRLISCLA